MENQNKTAIASWVIPGIILAIAVGVLFYNFSAKSNAGVLDTVVKNLSKSAQTYSDNFMHELEILSKTAEPIRVIAEREGIWDAEFEADMAEVLDLSTDAYRIIFSDDSGLGVDEHGEEVDIGDEEYFQKAMQADDTSYIYAEVTFDSEVKPSIVVSERIEGEADTSYLLLFYPMERFKNLMTTLDFDTNSFLALVDETGKVLGAAGATNSRFLKDGNLLETIAPENTEQALILKNRLGGVIKGNVSVTVQGEGCMLLYVPFGENRWEMILGISQNYVDKQVNMQWQTTKNMLFYLISAIFIFAIMVIVINIVGKIRNNEKKKELEDKADTDLLTNLTNKLATERKIKDYMSQNPNSQSMLFILDVDNFKKINDTMGHAFGDEVLRSLGHQLRAIFRASDIVGRVGGDEFMVFLKGVSDKESVRKEAKKVENFFQEFRAGEYVKYAATASIGVAIFPQEGNDFETLYKAADQGLYKAKKRGKNQLAFYREEWGLAEGEQPKEEVEIKEEAEAKEEAETKEEV